MQQTLKADNTFRTRVNTLHAGNIFLIFCCLLIFFKIKFFKTFIQEYYQSVNSLDPDQARYSVWPDLGMICLQRLSADDKSCP